MGVFGMRYPLVIIAVVVLALGSFADEAMLVSFALTLASGDSKNLTLLYALSMIGGVTASRSGAFILPKISEKDYFAHCVFSTRVDHTCLLFFC